MANPWDNDPIVQPAQQARQFPGIIQGAPDPYKAEDQQLQREANDRANAAADRQAAAAERAAATADRQANMDAQGKEFQAKSASFYGRMLQSQQDYGAIGGDSLPPRGVVRQNIHGAMPNVENSYLNDPKRQGADQAVENFIAAQLRLESGAAISPQEFDRQYRIFFPMPGDGPDVIAQKARARKQATEAMRLQAGPLADATEQTVQPSQGLDNGNGPPEGQVLIGYGKNVDGSQYPIYGAPGTPPPGAPPSGGGGNPAEASKLSAMDGSQAGISGVMTLAKQGMSGGLADEAAGVGGVIAAFLQGKDPNAAYYTNRDAARLTVDNAKLAHPYIGGAAEFLGGLGGAGVGNALAPTAGQVAGAAGLYGGITGFGNGNGAGDSMAQGLIGAGSNALLGYGLAKAAPAVANALTRPRGAAPDMAVIEAGQRQGIPVRAADAIPSAGNHTAAAEASPYGGPIIKRAMQSDNEAMAGKVRSLSDGHAQGDYALGQQVQGVGTRFIAKTRAQADRLYTRAREAAGNTSVTPTEADAVIDANLKELRAAGENSNAAAIKYLEGLRSDIDQGLSLEAVQNLRTNMRGQIGERGLTGTDTERRVGQVLDAMNRDLAGQLPPEAASALKAADSFYSQRQDFIKSVLKPFLGSRGSPMTPEQAGKAFRGMTAGRANYDALKRFMGEATPQELADFRSTIAESLVTGPKGDVGAAALARNIGNVPENIRSLVFGQDGAAALRDLQILANAKGNTAGGLNNSKSGVVGAAGKIGLRALLTSAFGFAAGGPVGAAGAPVATEVIAALGQARTARLLLNPDFTKWLRAAPQSSSPQVIDRYFARLGSIGSIAANDNAAFTSALRNIVGKSPAGAAAQDEQQAGLKPPQQ